MCFPQSLENRDNEARLYIHCSRAGSKIVNTTASKTNARVFELMSLNTVQNSERFFQNKIVAENCFT